MAKLSALILAAGNGTRMRPLTYTTPKPLLPVAGKPMIVHTLNALKNYGITDVFVLVNKSTNLETFKSELTKYRFNPKFIVQGDKYGTGAAVLAAENHIKQEFLVLAGDSVFDESAVGLLLHSNPNSLLALAVKDVSRYGSIHKQNGRVKKIVEKPTKRSPGYANISMYKFDTSIFDKLKKIKSSKRKEYEITDALTGMSITKYNKFWMDVAYPWHLLKANEVLLDKAAPDEYEAEIINSKIRGKVIAEEGVVIEDSVIEGNVYLSKNVKIGPHSYIRGSTSIGEGSVIGDSTTVKNSIIMRNVKAKHLSYIGDSVIGSNVNFGAGTQLANYRFDAKNIVAYAKNSWINTGTKKLGSIVGDNTKFGVLSSIMPGKLIGNDCWIGSGVVLGKNLSPNKHIFVRQDYTIVDKELDKP